MTYLIRRRPVHRAFDWQQAFDRMFDDSLFRPAGLRWNLGDAHTAPLALDLYETDDNIVIEAALPGIAPDEVDISIQDNTVTIKGELKSDVEDADNVTYHLRERRFYSAFQRTVSLPVEVNADAAEATFKNGILSLVLPKAEEVKPKRIEVKIK